jgi:hypothetical protein
VISPELADFLRGPYIYVLGSRDDALHGTCTYGFGAELDDEAETITVFVPDALLGYTIANLEANGEVAVLCGITIAHDTRQVKGTYLGSRPTTEREQALQDAHHVRLLENYRPILGDNTERYWNRFPLHPSTAITIRITEAFDQTPGPTAGHAVPATA